MSSDERQEAIWDIILQRKFETVPNIADELGVCTRTIYGDVTKMRKKYPIEPISGKYGGVYLVHKPHNAAINHELRDDSYRAERFCTGGKRVNFTECRAR